MVALFVLARPSEERATAAAYLKPAAIGDVTLEADLSLPHVLSNRGWYGIWEMLQSSGDPASVPFLQIGLMRRESAAIGHEGRGYIAPFVAYRRRGKTFVYFELDHVAKECVRSMRFSVGRRGATLFTKINGKTIHTELASDILMPAEPPTITFAAELFAYGDEAVGAVRSIKFSSEDPIRQVMNRIYFYDDRGTCLLKIGSGYEARGKFSSNLRGGFRSFPILSASLCNGK